VSGQINHLLFLTSRQAAAPGDLLLANSRLSRRLLSLNTCAAQLVGLVLGRLWDRCRDFLEYEPLAPRLPVPPERPSCFRLLGAELDLLADEGASPDCIEPREGE